MLHHSSTHQWHNIPVSALSGSPQQCSTFSRDPYEARRGLICERKQFLAAFCDTGDLLPCYSSVKLNSLSHICTLQQTYMYLNKGWDNILRGIRLDYCEASSVVNIPYSLEITPPPFCWLGLASSMGGAYNWIRVISLVYTPLSCIQ